MEKLNYARNSRNIYAQGVEASFIFSKLKILQMGCSGLGVEVARNLILMSIDKLKILILNQQENFSEKNKFSSYLHHVQSDLMLFQQQLQALNEDTHLSIEKQGFEEFLQTPSSTNGHLSYVESIIKDFDIVLLTETVEYAVAIGINEICRKYQKGFIYAASTGLVGFVFVDFGQGFTHSIVDVSEQKQAIIQQIQEEEKDEKGYSVTITTEEPHGFYDNEEILIKDLKQFEHLNNQKFQIERINQSTIKIYPQNFDIYTNNNSSIDYRGGGKVVLVQTPLKKDFCSLQEFLEQQSIKLLDLQGDGFGRVPNLDNLKQEYGVYLKEWVRAALPSNISPEQQISFIAQTEKYQSCNQNKTLQFLRNFQLGQFAPMTSYIGAILANECYKFTGRSTPIIQAIFYDFSIPLLSTQRAQQEINLTKKLSELKIAIVGAGAVGSELTKLLVTLDAATRQETGEISLIDYDLIELSNLSRQFFFRKHHIGKNKAQVITDECKAFYNPNSKLTAIAQELTPLNKLELEFWQKQDFVLAAVDSDKVRALIDDICFQTDKTMLEGGTGKFQASSECFIPQQTQRFRENGTKLVQEDQDYSISYTVEEKRQFCTLRGIPANSNDILAKAKAYYQNKFLAPLSKLRKCVIDKNYNAIFSLAQDSNEFREVERFVKILLNSSEKTVEDVSMSTFQVIESGKKFFYQLLLYLFYNKFYEINIYNKKQLQNQHCKFISNKSLTQKEYFNDYVDYALREFPIDAIVNNKYFWSGSRQPPKKLNFDVESQQHQVFIRTVKNIYTQIFKKKSQTNQQQTIDQTVTNDLRQAIMQITSSDLEDLVELSDELEDMYGNFNNDLFEFVKSCTILWCDCFTMETMNDIQLKLKYKQITPAIITTTSALASLMIIELLKLVNGVPFSQLCNYSPSLDQNRLLPQKLKQRLQYTDFISPLDQKLVQRIPQRYMSWNKIVEGPDESIEQFMTRLVKENNLKEINCIVWMLGPDNTQIIYAPVQEAHDKELKSKSVRQLILEHSNKRPEELWRFVMLQVQGFNTADGRVLFAPIKYIL